MRTRFRRLIGLLCLACTTLIPSHVQATLNVVASLPEYAALAKEVGGNEVCVTSLARGTENAHFVNPKPSYIRILNKADILIENGADMEAGWLPRLVEASRNPKLVLSLNSPTRILASAFVDMLGIPSGPVDRSMGDIHLFGDPHFHLSPNNAIAIAEGLKDRFCFLQPNVCSTFTQNFTLFEERIQQKIGEWKHQMKPLRDINAVEYHRTFTYLADSFEFSLVDALEPKPGIPPSARYIRELVPRMKAMNVKLILIEPFHEQKTPTFVAQQSGATLAVIPSTIGGVPGTDDYISLIDTIVSRLVEAASQS